MKQPASLKCQGCGAMVEFEISIQPLNTPGTSMILIEHPKPVVCSCGVLLTMIVNGAQGINLVTVPAPAEQAPLIVTAAAGAGAPPAPNNPLLR